jgi:hypothetical protein
MDDVLGEHHVVHELIAEVKRMKPDDGRVEAKFTELAENVWHHIKEEETKILPKTEDSDLDWKTLSSQVLKR